MTLGSYTLRLDPWQPDFGASIEDNGELEFGDEADVGVDLEVELPIAAWSPRIPGPRAQPERLWFVDGVRRVEARVMAGRDGRRYHGAFGAYAVGAVEVARGQARVAKATVVRLAILGSGQRLPEPLRLERALSYEPDSVAAETVDAPVHGIHNRMRATEAAQARELAETGLVLTDGPADRGGRPRAGHRAGEADRTAGTATR